MRSYDFNRQLDWKAFQTLACEVVQQRERIQLPDKTVLQQYIREITDRKLRTRNAREQKKSIEACRTFV